ncbi:MAG TPA: plastocyanin/azurin family copper-binding protein [Oryzihumus sp.]|nr:plastocyanin/azurin family copper-binding protein [Oryzihumus sp.]
MSVVEKEFSISLAPAPVHAGTYTFTVRNAGTFPHNLNIQGPGVAQQSSATVSPGQSAALTVTLQKGSYELWCSVDSHKERGMDVTLKVG